MEGRLVPTRLATEAELPLIQRAVERVSAEPSTQQQLGQLPPVQLPLGRLGDYYYYLHLSPDSHAPFTVTPSSMVQHVRLVPLPPEPQSHGDGSLTADDANFKSTECSPALHRQALRLGMEQRDGSILCDPNEAVTGLNELQSHCYLGRLTEDIPGTDRVRATKFIVTKQRDVKSNEPVYWLLLNVFDDRVAAMLPQWRQEQLGEDMISRAALKKLFGVNICEPLQFRMMDVLGGFGFAFAPQTREVMVNEKDFQIILVEWWEPRGELPDWFRTEHYMRQCLESRLKQGLAWKFSPIAERKLPSLLNRLSATSTNARLRGTCSLLVQSERVLSLSISATSPPQLQGVETKTDYKIYWIDEDTSYPTPDIDSDGEDPDRVLSTHVTAFQILDNLEEHAFVTLGTLCSVKGKPKPFLIVKIVTDTASASPYWVLFDVDNNDSHREEHQCSDDYSDTEPDEDYVFHPARIEDRVGYLAGQKLSCGALEGFDPENPSAEVTLVVKGIQGFRLKYAERVGGVIGVHHERSD